jgi:hypothetical protein
LSRKSEKDALEGGVSIYAYRPLEIRDAVKNTGYNKEFIT